MRLYAFIIGTLLQSFGLGLAMYKFYESQNPVSICDGIPYVAIGAILSLPYTFIILQKKA